MIKNNVDIFRLNFSWGDHKEHADFVEKIRVIAKKINRNMQ
jgi:pyruvate kinase